MPDRDERQPVTARRLFEMLVARAAAGHLERLALLARLVHVDHLDGALYPPPAAELARKFRVAVRFALARAVVEVRGYDAPVEKFLEHPERRDGIAAAGQSAYDAIRAGPALTLRGGEELLPRFNQRCLRALSVQTGTTVS